MSYVIFSQNSKLEDKFKMFLLKTDCKLDYIVYYK